jgi:hypothetical protein
MLMGNDQPLCAVNFTIVEICDAGEFSREKVCDACDDRLRKKGQEDRKKASAEKKKRVNYKVLYRPRNQFRD